MMDIVSLENKEFSIKMLLVEALRHYRHFKNTFNRNDAINNEVQQLHARKTADPAFKPETALEIITSEYVAAHEALNATRRQLAAERARLR